ncbi:MAG TPA: bifunctional diaminohydroxyphosphoribosylaminopyrimidine deaminase/5-amino-6-(5-phosphoribosylamino)uracil reductase RibD [Pirellulaceae bacterium]|nr:bifunctional diaminohydroxyphosphoribosylaminopyrimidine deaminase/5-amino-6-(5-phosphoribosylamino)uracil reductase RibD [Pirellulaceae bacterium]
MAEVSVDLKLMRYALELARRGQGFVEPNPLVGCVIVRDGKIISEGWHQQFGGAHAEIEALLAAGERARGATMYVTLEPCCHYGKTPPCTEAIIPAGLSRVVVAMRDPFPKVAGSGLKQLAAAGIDVELGLGEDEARALNAPYLKLVERGRPWTIAKWAMTLDGKIATRGGYSRWISGEASRQVVHQLRGRVDAIVVGRRTAQLDDPLLTARPEGSAPPRLATRIVLDSQARLASFSQLVRTARQIPTIIVTGPDAEEKELRRLADAGCEVLPFAAASHYERLLGLLDELGRRRMTNILVEGGGQLLGTLLDARELDEVHVFIAPKFFGGERAPSPLAGAGVEQVAEALSLTGVQVHAVGGYIYVAGRVGRKV